MWRFNNLKIYNNFKFYQVDNENFDDLKSVFQAYQSEIVINLADHAGVLYSLENPFICISTNAGGNLNILELCREYNVSNYVLDSTSSIYAEQEM